MSFCDSFTLAYSSCIHWRCVFHVLRDAPSAVSWSWFVFSLPFPTSHHVPATTKTSWTGHRKPTQGSGMMWTVVDLNQLFTQLIKLPPCFSPSGVCSWTGLFSSSHHGPGRSLWHPLGIWRWTHLLQLILQLPFLQGLEVRCGKHRLQFIMTQAVQVKHVITGN